MATDVDGGGGGAEYKGDGGVGGALLLPLLLPVEEYGQSVRAIETATRDVVCGWFGSSVPEADVHCFDDDMAARRDGQAS